VIAPHGHLVRVGRRVRDRALGLAGGCYPLTRRGGLTMAGAAADLAIGSGAFATGGDARFT
jgi:hypothetical protein